MIERLFRILGYEKIYLAGPHGRAIVAWVKKGDLRSMTWREQAKKEFWEERDGNE